MTKPDYIVDAHHHLWDLNACHYPWLMERGVPRFFGDPTPIQKDYLPADFSSDIGRLKVKKSVHIQVGVSSQDAVLETEWLQQVGNTSGCPDAIVAFCDLELPSAARVLDAHQAHDRLRGIRQIVGRSAEEDRRSGTGALLDSRAFLDGLRMLQKRGLSFDLQLTPPLMNQAAHCFGAVDDLPIALCHAGSLSDPSPDGLREWSDGLKQLAALPALICKMSGFGMFDRDWTIESIRPHVLTVIDIFGPDRIAFGSNFPVDKLNAPYARVMGAYLEITRDFSAIEINAMFATTAETFYRI